jgi:hypothetical protein
MPTIGTAISSEAEVPLHSTGSPSRELIDLAASHMECEGSCSAAEAAAHSQAFSAAVPALARMLMPAAAGDRTPTAAAAGGW